MKKLIEKNGFDPKTNERYPFKAPIFKKIQGAKYLRNKIKNSQHSSSINLLHLKTFDS